MVSLEKVTADNFRQCLQLKVSDGQSHFVSSNMLSLAKAYVFNDIVTPFAIYNDETMVGFIMLRFNEKYSNYFIWEFMIDESYQSKGFGKQALKSAIEWIKKDKRCYDIVTTYIEGNENARKLYSSFGFQQIGGPEEGEIDMILHL
jgi:diamine N-acetyltransferase